MKNEKGTAGLELLAVAVVVAVSTFTSTRANYTDQLAKPRVKPPTVDVCVDCPKNGPIPEYVLAGE